MNVKRSLLFPFRVALTALIFLAAGALTAYVVITGEDWQG